jgi:hypothetical protein
MNKNKWVLLWNGEKGEAITFKQDISLKKEDKTKYPTAFKNNLCFDYNLIDIRRINKESQDQNLSIYFSGKKTKEFLFNNRVEALKYMFKEYPFLNALKGGIK